MSMCVFSPSQKEPREPIYLYEPGSVQFLGGEAPFPPRGHGTGAFRGMRGRGGPPRGRGVSECERIHILIT